MMVLTNLLFFFGPGYITAGPNIAFSYDLSTFASISTNRYDLSIFGTSANQRYTRQQMGTLPNLPACLAEKSHQFQFHHRRLEPPTLICLPAQPKNHSTRAKKQDQCDNQDLYTQSTVFPPNLLSSALHTHAYMHYPEQMFLLVEGSGKQWQIPEEAAINPREKMRGGRCKCKGKNKAKIIPKNSVPGVASARIGKGKEKSWNTMHHSYDE